jgi:hypothetical protein
MRGRVVPTLALVALVGAGCGLISGLDSLNEATDGSDASRTRDAADERERLPDGALVDDDGSSGGDGNPGGDGSTPMHPDVIVPDGHVLVFVTVTGVAGGHVQSNYPVPNGIDCTTAGGTSCWLIYAADTLTMLLFANGVDGGPQFAEWGGACTAALTNECDLPMNHSYDITARYK